MLHHQGGNLMTKVIKNVGSLAVLSTVLLIASCAGETSSSASSSVSSSANTAPTVLTVGRPASNGNMIAGWGNSSYDVWIRDLIGAYGTYTTTPEGQIILDETVVTDLKKNDDFNGNRTYEFTIAQDLVWNDGTKITAQDYVFGILLAASRDWQVAGANVTTADGLAGRAKYRAGVNNTSIGVVFEGVRLLGEFTFAVTIAADKLPYFYEVTYASFGPSPMHVMTPAGSRVISDANGSTMSAGSFANIPQLIAADGYRFRPLVSAGPYKFISNVNNVITVEINPLFKGDYRGKKPTIDRIISKEINTLLDVDQVISGDIDLTLGVIEGEKIEKAKAAASQGVQALFYNRNGYGFLGLTADFGPTKDPIVRQAVTLLVDKEYVTDIVLGGYGSPVYSEYGFAQWMAVQSEDWIAANIVQYPLNATRANQLLDTTEWKFEADGVTPFSPAKAAAQNTTTPFPYVRHNAAKQVLALNHMGSEGNIVTTSLQTALPREFAKAGIQFTTVQATFATLLDNYYDGYLLEATGERRYHMFNLATNFSVAYDPYYSWHSDFYQTGVSNPNGLKDDIIDDLTVKMRSLDPSQTAEFLEFWRQYQKRWNFLMPNVPLYSNTYFDIAGPRVKGLETTPFWSWAQDIMDVEIVG
jgi:peptide/nickel transport system substrate-binding protein